MMQRAGIAAVQTRVFYVIVIGLGILGTVIGTMIASNGITAEQLQTKLIIACETERTQLRRALRDQHIQLRGDTYDPARCADQYR